MPEIKDMYDRRPSIKSITSITVITRRKGKQTVMTGFQRQKIVGFRIPLHGAIYITFNHNYNKILESDWLSPAMI